jgi:hypothetical protein
MTGSDDILYQKALRYASQHQMEVRGRLGHGKDGIVFVAASKLKAMRSAIKSHSGLEAYQRERRAYERLAECRVRDIEGFHVPQFLGADDELLVIEMTIVTRPFVLDFASAYLDRPPEFPEGVMDDWEAEKREEFGGNWPVVESVLQTLRSHGVHLLDVNPRNITFLDRE